MKIKKLIKILECIEGNTEGKLPNDVYHLGTYIRDSFDAAIKDKEGVQFFDAAAFRSSLGIGTTGALNRLFKEALPGPTVSKLEIFDPATGIFKKFDDEMLFEEAAGKTLNIIPVYDRVPKILEKMRDIPVLGAFTAFPAENLRNNYRILKLGAEELKEGFETGNKALQIAWYERIK